MNFNITTKQYTKDDLKTGDIILCHCQDPTGKKPDPGLDGIIEIATHSPWEHAALIVKDPWWGKEQLSGLYVFQSGTGPNGYPDVLNGKLCGVTLNHLNDFLANREEIFVRSLENVDLNTKQKKTFVKAFQEAHGKPYDSTCWYWCWEGIDSFLRCRLCKCCIPKHTDKFWCSALVAFMYVKMGWFDPDLDWSDQTPADLAQTYETQCPYKLSSIWKLK